MLHRLCGPPSIPLSFSLAAVLPRRSAYWVTFGTEGLTPPTPSTHRLRRGLPRYLILFAPHAFAPQRQLQAREPPAPPVFLPVSTHPTAAAGIPLPCPGLKRAGRPCTPTVGPWSFSRYSTGRLRALCAQ